MDYTLPDIDGAKICWRLKRAENTKNVPIVFMSAQDENKLRQIVADCGADGFIDAFLDGKELVKKIKAVIGNQ